jgi:lipid A 3-O-deacylase
MKNSPGDEVDRRPLQARGAILLGACLLVVGAPVPKADAESSNGTFSLVVENDIFYNTDRSYTNGIRFSWLSAPARTPDWAVHLARRFPLFPEEGVVRVNYAIGQNMYTPADITVPDPPFDDRPYAGWLYGSVGVVAETGDRLDQLELSLGMVGPASFGEETQKFFHDAVGADKPRGWGTQIGNEPAVMLSYQRSWRGWVSESLFGIPYDVTPHGGGTLGNVSTYGSAGLTVRYGKPLLRDFGPPRIQPSLPGSGVFIPPERFGWYLFGGVEGRAVARNIFLDGNTFRDSRSVSREPLVADIQLGITASWRNYRLSYTHVRRTREFKSQVSGDNFGAVSFSMQL